MPLAEEAGVVRFQAVKELTDSPDDVVIDYVTAGAPPGREQQAQALIVRREILNTYLKICHAAGLKLAALTPRPFGVAASLRKATADAAAAEDAADAVVVVGDRWAEFAVLRGQTPLLSRTMAVGPGLAGEVRRNLTVYAGQAGRPPVRAVYVAGAGAELRQRLNDVLEIPLHEFDPFAGAVGLDVPAGGRGGFAGAAGLLFARAEARGLPINFVQPRQPKPPANPNNRRVRVRRRRRGRRLGRRRLLLLGRLRPGRQPPANRPGRSATGWNSSSRRSARRASCTRRWTTGIMSIGSTNCTT